MRWLMESEKRPMAVAVVIVCFLLGGALSWLGNSTRGNEWNHAIAEPVVREPGNLESGPAFRIRETTAAALLESLPVKGRAPKTGYKREQFGAAWTDVDRNGCDTRNDVLRRDLLDAEFVRGSSCLVAAGILLDPYTGAQIDFQRGSKTSAAVQIDHVVALGDAWQKGGQRLEPNRRLALANDPLNLLAVDGPANGKKSDGDAATWLPPNESFRCGYVARQISVKAAYSLWVTEAEKTAMAKVLGGCMQQQSQGSGL